MAQEMAAHQQAFPALRRVTGGRPPTPNAGGRPRNPRGGGKSNPEGGVARLPDLIVARRLWCEGTTAQSAASRKPRNAAV